MKQDPSSILRVRLTAPDGAPATVSFAAQARLRAAAQAYGLAVSDSGSINGDYIVALFHHPHNIAAPESFIEAARKFSKLAEEITSLSATVDVESFSPALIYL